MPAILAADSDLPPGSAELSVTTGNTERGLDFEDQQVKVRNVDSAF